MMINTREIAKEYRLSHWSQIMRERVSSGMNIKEFCRHIGICGNTYFYWQRRVRAATCEQLALNRPKNRLPIPSFVEARVTEPAALPALPEPTPPSQLRIEIGNIQMTADNTYPPDKLAELLRILSKPC